MATSTKFEKIKSVKISWHLRFSQKLMIGFVWNFVNRCTTIKHTWWYKFCGRWPPISYWKLQSSFLPDFDRIFVFSLISRCKLQNLTKTFPNITLYHNPWKKSGPNRPSLRKSRLFRQTYYLTYSTNTLFAFLERLRRWKNRVPHWQKLTTRIEA